MNVEQWPLNPGDLIYTRDPDDGTVHTEILWTVGANEGTVPGERLAPSMPWKTYWEVWVRCDGTCQTSDCEGPNTRHCFMLSADDYVHASRLPEFEVQR